jgi:hypothetical protein
MTRKRHKSMKVTAANTPISTSISMAWDEMSISEREYKIKIKAL